MKKAAILAAGEGSRLKTSGSFKPIIKINGTPLLELTYNNLDFENFNQVLIIFNEEQKVMSLRDLTCLNNVNTNYFFKSTPSSMHSLFEVSKRLNLCSGEHFFVSMVDSIIDPKSALKFHQFCKTLGPSESAIIATSYIDDESPLTLKINDLGYVTQFQCPIDENVLVTSGVYYLSFDILHHLNSMIQSGQTKMRNLLAELIKLNHKIKVFHVEKTLDVDRPIDIINAEIFLRELTP